MKRTTAVLLIVFSLALPGAANAAAVTACRTAR